MKEETFSASEHSAEDPFLEAALVEQVRLGSDTKDEDLVRSILLQTVERSQQGWNERADVLDSFHGIDLEGLGTVSILCGRGTGVHRDTRLRGPNHGNVGTRHLRISRR